jgi:hypothetical protein
MPLLNVSVAQLRRAVSIKQRIDNLEAELVRILGSSDGSLGANHQGKRSGRRGISASGRARIAAAQRKRWAEVRSNASKAKRARQ